MSFKTRVGDSSVLYYIVIYLSYISRKKCRSDLRLTPKLGGFYQLQGDVKFILIGNSKNLENSGQISPGWDSDHIGTCKISHIALEKQSIIAKIGYSKIWSLHPLSRLLSAKTGLEEIGFVVVLKCSQYQSPCSFILSLCLLRK